MITAQEPNLDHDKVGGVQWTIPMDAGPSGVKLHTTLQENPDAEDRYLVANPYGRALRSGIELNRLLVDNPEHGNETLSTLVTEVLTDIKDAVESGYRGIVYLVFGATARECTPMQFGGYYLERDREILQSISTGLERIVFVVGDEETYLDFVSDLPGEIFAWDSKSTGFSLDEVRELRDGQLCTNDPHAEIFLNSSHDVETPSQFFYRQLKENHAR